MATGRVVLYFEKQEDAVQFTLAASSMISADGTVRVSEAAQKVAREICKASRIRTEGTLNLAAHEEDVSQPESQCA
ncbi:MAG TPA: hypothetical protein VMH85_13430 [Terriglobales bacterium]|nr:hypothetical protein [Terriglobales bacterium]